jgi:hypothetical protein
MDMLLDLFLVLLAVFVPLGVIAVVKLLRDIKTILQQQNISK